MSTNAPRASSQRLPALGILLLAAWVGASPAEAGQLDIRGNGTILDGTLDATSPLWDRPKDTGSTLSPTCGATAADSWNDAVPHERHPFLVSTATAVSLTATGSPGFDPVVALYCEPSSVAAPLAQLIGVDDDGAGYPNPTLGVPLAPGLYWVVVSAYSNYAPWGGYELTLSGGQFVEPPRVTELRTIDGLGQPALINGSELDRAVTEIQVGYDQEMQDGVDADDVTNTANYLLVEAGADDTVETTSCIGGVAGSDLQKGLAWAEWYAAAERAILGLSRATGLPAGSYRLLACGSTTLRSEIGLALDGDGNGVGGDDYRLDFDVSTTNLLKNPNFDLGASSWTLAAGASWSSNDSEGAPHSGSIELLTDEPASTAEQCLDLSTPGLRLRGRVLTQGAASLEPRLSLTPFAATDCSGAELPNRSWEFDPGVSSWLDFELFAAIEDAASVKLELSSDTGTEGSTSFDALSLIGEPGLVFADDFESGDVTLWSSEQPPP